MANPRPLSVAPCGENNANMMLSTAPGLALLELVIHAAVKEPSTWVVLRDVVRNQTGGKIDWWRTINQVSHTQSDPGIAETAIVSLEIDRVPTTTVRRNTGWRRAGLIVLADVVIGRTEIGPAVIPRQRVIGAVARNSIDRKSVV